MSAGMADALLKKGSGDAALLYLYLLRHDGYYEPEEVGRALKWERTRLDSAMVHLGELGIQTGEPRPDFVQPIPDASEAPEYSREDLAQVLNSNGDFSYLYEAVRGMYGVAALPDRDTKTLLELFDHLGLPAEVLLLIVSHECEEYQKKYNNPAKNPPMSFIRRTAYRWKKSGVDTLEAADSFLKRQEYYITQEGALLNAVGIFGREAAAGERKFLRQWIDWGFPPKVVSIAYERTLMGTGQMKWSYCNAILRNWHEKGLHTVEEVQSANAPRRPQKQTASNMAPAPARAISAAEREAQDRAFEENQRQVQKLLEFMGMDNG